MRIVFRADASVTLGSGHVMRCAALARRLGDDNHEVSFICREAAGDLIGWLRAQGFPVSRLPLVPATALSEGEDAAACRELIGRRGCDWLIVDNYGLGRAWEG